MHNNSYKVVKGLVLMAEDLESCLKAQIKSFWKTPRSQKGALYFCVYSVEDVARVCVGFSDESYLSRDYTLNGFSDFGEFRERVMSYLGGEHGFTYESPEFFIKIKKT